MSYAHAARHAHQGASARMNPTRMNSHRPLVPRRLRVTAPGLAGGATKLSSGIQPEAPVPGAPGVAQRLPNFAVEVLPPRHTTRDMQALKTGMAALALTLDRPIACELVGTPRQRRFVLRATDAAALAQLVRQVRARYPQMLVQPLTADEDALRLAPGETASVTELRPGAATYLPYRSWRERELSQAGADPLLGLLAALGALHGEMRAIVQLALIPAAETWSKSHQRLSVEHPLEQERTHERLQMAEARLGGSETGIGLSTLVLLLALLGLALLVIHLQPWLPLWVRDDERTLLHAHALTFTLAQTGILVLSATACLALSLLLVLGVGAIRGRLRRQPLIYDQRLVQEKTAQPAYHARLRLIVIGPKDCTPHSDHVPVSARISQPTEWVHVARRPWRRRWQRRWRTARSGARMLKTCLSEACAVWTFPVRRPPTRSRRARQAPSRRLSRWTLACVTRSATRTRQTWRARRTRRAAEQAQCVARREVLNALIAAYRQYHLANGAFFTPRSLNERAARSCVRCPSERALRWNRVPLVRRFCGGWQRGLWQSRHILSIADVAGLWHLPQGEDLAELPFVERTRARTLLVPPVLAQPDLGFQIGQSSHAGFTLPVCLPPDAVRRNTLVVAKTGKGKSTLLLAQARAALAAPSDGLVLIDPHGDLADALLGLIPETRCEDTLLIDVGDRACPLGMNPLDVLVFADRDKAVANVLAVLSQIWQEFWGPRMESALSAALKTLHEANTLMVARNPEDGPDRQYTLLDATPLLTRDVFRHTVMASVSDPALREYWERYEALSERLRQDIITPVTTKLDQFASSQVARRIVGQGRSTLDLGEALRRNQVVLVKTGRGVVGPDVAALIGALLLGLLQMTLAEQVAKEETARQRVRVIVDEFQTLPGVDFGAMLSELRKFGASFALATQALAHLDTLDKALRATVLANVDQLFAFCMSEDDARVLVRGLDESDAIVDTTDLISLDDFTCYCRLTLHGRRLPIFSLQLNPPPTCTAEQAERAVEIITRSQARVGRPAHAVDDILASAAARRAQVPLAPPHAKSARHASNAGQLPLETANDRFEHVAILSPTASDDWSSEVPGANTPADEVKRPGRGRWQARGTRDDTAKNAGAREAPSPGRNDGSSSNGSGSTARPPQSGGTARNIQASRSSEPTQPVWRPMALEQTEAPPEGAEPSGVPALAEGSPQPDDAVLGVVMRGDGATNHTRTVGEDADHTAGSEDGLAEGKRESEEADEVDGEGDGEEDGEEAQDE